MSARPFFSWRSSVVGSDLPSTTKLILHTLATYMNDIGESCFPSVERLKADSSLSKRAVIKHLGEAEAKGWITVSKRRCGDRKWARNEYKIAWPHGSKRGPPDAPRRDGATDQMYCGALGAPTPGKVDAPSASALANGGAPNDQILVHEVHPNSPENSPKKYIYDDLKNSEKAGFEELWSILPHVPNDPKKNARQAYAVRLRQGAESQALVKAARVYAAWAAEQSGFWPCHAATWLAEERDASADLPVATEVQSKHGSETKTLPVHVTPNCPEGKAGHWNQVVGVIAERHGLVEAKNWLKGVVFDGEVAWVQGQFTREQVANRFLLELDRIEVRVGEPPA